MAPPSARQFVSPTRSKFSSPLSPSISVRQPAPPLPAQPSNAAALSAAAIQVRFMSPPWLTLQRADLHLAPLDRAALRAVHPRTVLQREEPVLQLVVLHAYGLHAVQLHDHLRALGRDLVDVPLAARLVLDRHRHRGNVDDRTGAVLRL